MRTFIEYELELDKIELLDDVTLEELKDLSEEELEEEYDMTEEELEEYEMDCERDRLIEEATEAMQELLSELNDNLNHVGGLSL